MAIRSGAPIQGNDLQFAVNTNWDLFQHTPTKTLYLRATDTWLKAPALQGPWTYAGLLPDSFYKLPNDANWKAAKGALPGKQIAPSDAPKVFATHDAGGADSPEGRAELRAGQPARPACSGSATPTAMSSGWAGRARCTSSSRAAGSRRPISAARGRSRRSKLPDDFKKIPLEHPRSRVLASVPGTPEAAEAVLLAQIPETATRRQGSAGARRCPIRATPEFQPIETTTVQRAVNTDKDIIKVGDLYYMCFQGVWFMSRTPTGPWEVTGDVPKAIYTIPVSSPSYSVTYVAVQSSRRRRSCTWRRRPTRG